jgi:hypothetical protein
MEKIVDNCVGCPDGCRNCGRREQRIQVCDICEDNPPKFNFDGDRICEYCLKQYLEDIWNDMTEDDKIEALGGEYMY